MGTWVRDSIFYQIFTLGFCGVLEQGLKYSEENRFIKIEKLIPHLKKMNINAIYFGPIFESSSHGYDTIDYYKIDKRLGTNEDFKNLCIKLHENGIKIVLDGVFNHVGREFKMFKDVQINNSNSKYCGWFDGINFNGRSPLGDNFDYNTWHGYYELVKLNLKNKDVVDYILGAVKIWIDEFDIDGLRLDAADSIDFEFFKILKNFTNSNKKDFWLMGEVIHGDYNLWANRECLDSVTNYECYKGIYSSHNDKNYFEIAYSLNRQFGQYGIYKDLYLYNFIDNHDVNRIASTLKVPDYIYNAYILLYAMPGVPSIYYGSEFGIKGIKGRNTDSPLRPELEIENIQDKNEGLFNLIKKLGKIRTESCALKYGNYEQVIVRNEQYVFSRTSGEDKVYVLLNLSDKECTLEFYVSFDKIVDLLDNKNNIISGGNVKITVPAFSGKILTKAEEN